MFSLLNLVDLSNKILFQNFDFMCPHEFNLRNNRSKCEVAYFHLLFNNVHQYFCALG